MKTKTHKGCFSSKGLWQGNDLMDTGVTVFWPGLKLVGALTRTVSQTEGANKQAEAPTAHFRVIFLFFSQ